MRTKLSLALTMAALAFVGPAQAQESTERTLEAVDIAVTLAAKKAAKSVVLVEVDRANYGSRPLSRGERMRLGVRRWYDPRYFTRPEGPTSGVVIAPGLVATSIWNVQGEGTIQIVGPDGTKYSASRAGKDENLAVALIKVSDPKKTLVPIEAATSTVRVGRTVLLVGRTSRNAPLLTRGIVSGLGRERGDAFTHSAKTSYANAGGALVDLEGKLLGLSVRHSNRHRQGQSSGVAFGARRTRILANLQTLAAGKTIKKRPTAFLGIQMDSRFRGAGVRIMQVIDGTGAKTAGISGGDVIVVFNNVKIRHFSQLVKEIQKLEVGKKIVVTVKRDGREIDFTVKLGKRPEGR